MLIASRTPISKQTKAAVTEAIDHELWIKHPKRIRKSWSLTIVSWRKKWKSSARSSTYQISPGKKRQKRNRNTVASGKSFSEAVLIGNGNSRLHSIEVSNNPSAINSGVVVWCCFPVEIFSLFVWTYYAFCFNIQISKAKQDLENQKAESDKNIKQHASDSKVNKMARDGADQLRRDAEKDRRALQKAVDSAKVDLEEKAKELTKYQTLVGCTGTQAWS